MALVLGLNAKLYWNDGTWAVPDWQLIGNAKDVTLNLEKGEADVTVRANNGWRAMVGTLKEGSVEFEMMWDTADAGFTAIKDAYFADTSIEIAVMDGLIVTVGSEGLHADMSVTNFSRNEPLEEALTVSVSVKPTYSVNEPEWLVVT